MRILRIIDFLLVAGILLLAFHTLLILFAGGRWYLFSCLMVKGWETACPLIALLVLVIFRVCLKAGGFSWRAVSKPLSLFSVFLIIYLSNGLTLGSVDTLPARYLPLSILREGDFDLNQFPWLHRRDDPANAGIILVKGRYVSQYPVGVALLAIPVYLPSAIGSFNADSPLLLQLEKLAAAILTACSAVVFYLLLLRLTSRHFALLLTTVYALGTSSLSVSSQALWQHGPSQLALVAAVYCLVRGQKEPAWIARSGFPLAFAVICRPADFLVALPLGLYVLFHHRSQALYFAMSGLPPVLFQLWYNITYFGDPLHTQFPVFDVRAWATPFRIGLSGILASPGRGLFIYSPIFLLSLIGIVLAWRKNSLFPYLSVGALFVILLHSRWVGWWGGHTYGPRLLADITPILALFLFPLERLLRQSTVLKAVFVILTVWSLGAHLIGAFWDDPQWNVDVDVDHSPQHVWNCRDNQLVNAPKRLLDRAVIVAWRLPTSETDPALLAARYRLDFGPRVAAKGSIDFPLEIKNVGQAVWLAKGMEKGVVRVAWRFFNNGREVGGLEGRHKLRYDVFPAQSYRCHVTIEPPTIPGAYILELGMVSENLAWFSELGSTPVRVLVEADSLSSTKITVM